MPDFFGSGGGADFFGGGGGIDFLGGRKRGVSLEKLGGSLGGSLCQIGEKNLVGIGNLGIL